jgi:hypothetical protein
MTRAPTLMLPPAPAAVPSAARSTATAHAGHRAYFLKGPGLLLNQALINYGLSFLGARDYTPLQVRGRAGGRGSRGRAGAVAAHARACVRAWKRGLRVAAASNTPIPGPAPCSRPSALSAAAVLHEPRRHGGRGAAVRL